MKVGLLSDSLGDLGALGRAVDLLTSRGAGKLFFLGGRYSDIDELVLRRKQRSRDGRAYDTVEFLQDVESFLKKEEGGLGAKLKPEQPFEQLRARISRVPCSGSLEYRDPKVPKRLVELVGGHLACLVHDRGDLR